MVIIMLEYSARAGTVREAQYVETMSFHRWFNVLDSCSEVSFSRGAADILGLFHTALDFYLNKIELILRVSSHARTHTITVGWPGVAKMSCILRHRGIQLILAYSRERPVILVAGNVFISSVSSLSLFFLFIPCSSLSSPLLSLLSRFSLSLNPSLLLFKKPSDIYWLAALVKDPKSIKSLWTAREGSGYLSLGDDTEWPT